MRGYLEEGADVVIADVRDDLVEALAAEVPDHSLLVHLDVTRSGSPTALIEDGRRDLLQGRHRAVVGLRRRVVGLVDRCRRRRRRPQHTDEERGR